MEQVRRIYDWMGSKVDTPYGVLWLYGFFFIEACIFPIPVDPLLILFCLKQSARCWYFATIASIASVAGGVFGYAIGALLWNEVGDWFLHWVISPEAFSSIIAQYSLYQNWAVAIAGFTPVPYKAVTLSAGFCQLPLVPFIWYSLLSRSARFFLVAGAIHWWGESIRDFIDRYFDLLVVAFSVIVIAAVIILKNI